MVNSLLFLFVWNCLDFMYGGYFCFSSCSPWDSWSPSPPLLSIRLLYLATFDFPLYSVLPVVLYMLQDDSPKYYLISSRSRIFFLKIYFYLFVFNTKKHFVLGYNQLTILWVSGEQQRDLAIHRHASTLPQLTKVLSIISIKSFFI